MSSPNKPNSQGRLPVIVIGGTGVTGRMVRRILKRYGIESHYTSRKGGPEAEHHVLELNDSDSDFSEAVRLLSGFTWAVICVGPFEAVEDTFHQACLSAGTNIVDVNDYRELAIQLRQEQSQAEDREVRVLTGWGLSPGMSTAVVLRLAKQWPVSIADADVTTELSIGRGQESGAAAVRSMFRTLRSPHIAVREGKLIERSRPHPSDDGYIAYETPDVHYIPLVLKTIRSYEYRVRFAALTASDVRMLSKRRIFTSQRWEERLASFFARMASKKARKAEAGAQEDRSAVLTTTFYGEDQKLVARLVGLGPYALTAAFAATAVAEAMSRDLSPGVIDPVTDPEFTDRVLARVLAGEEVRSFNVDRER